MRNVAFRKNLAVFSALSQCWRSKFTRFPHSTDPLAITVNEADVYDDI